MASCRSSPPCTTERKKCRLHWSCWSPPGVPKASHGLAVAQRERRRQGRTGPCARPQRGRQPRFQPEHLGPGAEAEAERPGWSGNSATSRRWAWRRPCCRSGRRRRGGRCRRSDPPVGTAYGRLAHRRLAGTGAGPGAPAPAWRVASSGVRPSGLPGRSSWLASPADQGPPGGRCTPSPAASPAARRCRGRRTRPPGRRRRAWRTR